MTILNILAIIASGISILSVIWMVAFKLAGMMQKINALENNGCARLQIIDAKVTRLSVQMEPFWSLVETSIATSLKHPHTQEYDRLLSSIQNNLNINDLNLLSDYLRDELNEAQTVKDNGRVLSIALVLARVEYKKKLTV